MSKETFCKKCGMTFRSYYLNSDGLCRGCEKTESIVTAVIEPKKAVLRDIALYDLKDLISQLEDASEVMEIFYADFASGAIECVEVTEQAIFKEGSEKISAIAKQVKAVRRSLMYERRREVQKS